MIAIEDLHFSWPDGRQVFSGLNLTFPAAKVTAITGPNGTGKTTLLRLIAGLEKPLRGTVRIAGRAAGPGRNMARQVGAVMQNADRHFLCSTVLDEVAVTPRMLGLDHAHERAQAALRRLGLDMLAGRHPLDLDAGARRLVGLAAATAHEPQVLLLDEAQRGLDRLYLRRLEATILAEAGRGTTVLLVSHDAGFIGRTAGRLIDLTPDSAPPV